jgi:hypothetical protein
LAHAATEWNVAALGRWLAVRKLALLSILFCSSLIAATIQRPAFSARRDYPSAGGRIVVGDVNGDGIPDVVAVGSENLVSILLGNGNGRFRPAVTMNVQWHWVERLPT